MVEMMEYCSNNRKKGLTLGADVVIATPGRLIAHLSLGYVDLSKVSYFILDEADRMLDMGFYEDIMQLRNICRRNDRQSCFLQQCLQRFSNWQTQS